MFYLDEKLEIKDPRGQEIDPKIALKSHKFYKKGCLEMLLFSWSFLLSHFHWFGLHFYSIWSPFLLHFGFILGEKTDFCPMTPPGLIFVQFLSIWHLILEGFWTQPPPNRLQDLKKRQNIPTINLHENGDPALPPGGSQCAGFTPQRGWIQA